LFENQVQGSVYNNIIINIIINKIIFLASVPVIALQAAPLLVKVSFEISHGCARQFHPPAGAPAKDTESKPQNQQAIECQTPFLSFETDALHGKKK